MTTTNNRTTSVADSAAQQKQPFTTDDDFGPELLRMKAQMDVEESEMVPAGMGPAVEEKHDTVAFVEEGTVVRGDSFTNGTDDESAQLAIQHDIKDFLTRPIRVGDFKFDEQVRSTSVFRFMLPKQWFENAMIRNKLQGFQFVRCKFKVRVQVNAQPFQQGRLLVWYDPLYDQNSYTPSSARNLSGMTGYPNVELDFSSGTAAELEVPFHPVISHYDIVRGFGTAGRVNITSMSKASSPVYGTVWVTAEDVDLQVATPFPVYTPPSEEERLLAQIDKTEKRRPGNIETISKQISRLAASAAVIPGVGAVTGTVSAVADAVAGVASIFGFSKPIDPNFSTMTDPTLGRFVANFNGDTKRKHLALDSRNETSLIPNAFGTTEDEMNIKYVAGKSNYFGNFSWDKTALEGKVLYTWAVSPFSAKVIDASISNKYYMTLLSYVSMLFQFWRGSIKYRISAVKTNYHSGRFRVFFTPGDGFSGETTSGIEISNAYSKIFDLRDGYDFEIEVPFVHYNYWMPQMMSTGTLSVEVINTLVAPDVAPPSIEFLLFAGGGDDIEFAVPISDRLWQPINANEAQTGALGGSDEELEHLKAQSNNEFFPTNRKEDFKGINFTTGEVITSFRQVLKRYGYFTPNPALNETWEPFRDNSQNSTTAARGAAVFSMFAYISRLYRFYNGSMNILVQSNLRAEPLRKPVAFTLLAPSLATIPPTEVRGMHPEVYFHPDIEGLIEIGIPYYKQFPISPTNLGGVTAADASYSVSWNKFPTTNTFLALQNHDSVGKDTLEIRRAIGDDFSFGFLVGAPAVYALN